MSASRFIYCVGFVMTASCVRAATLSDCNEGALAAAVSAGGDVVFACDGVIAQGSPLVITQSVTLDAGGRAVTLDGRGSNQLFVVRSNGILTLRGLSLVNGRATNQFGGAISNGGVLRLERCVLSNHLAQSTGSPQTPWVGYGGAIHIGRGEVTLSECWLVNNTARGTDGAQSGTFYGGHGYGGAIYLADNALRVSNCVFAGNLAKAGNGPTNMFGGYPGGDGAGGAVFARTGSVVISGCQFTGNRAEGGDAGRNRNAGVAVGGAVAIVDDLPARVEASTFTGNSVLGGNGWIQTQPYGWAGDASGGAIYRVPFRTVISNCTFVANRAIGGSTTNHAGSPYGQGRGGAVSGFGVIAYCTITSNSVTSGVGCLYLPTGSGTQVGQARSCIYAWNSNAPNLELTLDLGYNVSTDSRQFTNSTSITNVDPRLGPLADNGGPVWTMALLPGSPALDAIPPGMTGVAPADARGVTRPSGGGLDAGAFELSAPSAPHLIGSLTSGMFRATFTAEAGYLYQLLGSENLADWRTNGSVLMGTNGTARFDVMPDGTGKFYRIQVP